MKSPPQQSGSLPASKALLLVELLKRFDVSADQLLDGSNVDLAALEKPDCHISISTMSALVDRARALTGEPGLGFYIGLHRRLSMYNSIFVVTANVRTLGEGLDLLVRASSLIATAITFRLKVEGSLATLIFEENADLGSMRDYAVFSLLAGFWPTARFLTGRNLNESFDIAFPEPPYYQRFSHLMPDTRFNQPLTQIRFDASLLTLPFITPDREVLKSAREQCERELMTLGFGQAIVERVRNLLKKPGGLRPLKAVAADLHLTPRTLKRQLAAKRASFSQLLDHERREKALILLRSSNITLEEVTEYVGYSTVPNFIRAFRRWTGKTPAEYRRILQDKAFVTPSLN